MPVFALKVLHMLNLVIKLGLSFTDRQVEALNLFVELEKRLIELTKRFEDVHNCRRFLF